MDAQKSWKINDNEKRKGIEEPLLYSFFFFLCFCLLFWIIIMINQKRKDLNLEKKKKLDCCDTI